MGHLIYNHISLITQTLHTQKILLPVQKKMVKKQFTGKTCLSDFRYFYYRLYTIINTKFFIFLSPKSLFTLLICLMLLIFFSR